MRELRPAKGNSRPAAVEEEIMEGLLQEARLVSPELLATVPETLAEAEELAVSIERAVQRETGYGVQNLRVEVSREGVLLRGRCDTFYCKQLAQHAAMGCPGGTRLTNCIEVS